MSYRDREEEYDADPSHPDRADADDRDLPDPADMDPPGIEDDADTFPCPYCRDSVYETAEVCSNCGSCILDESVARRGRPWWLVAGVVVCLVIVVLTWVL